MSRHRRSGFLYLLVLALLVSALAWPVFVAVNLALTYWMVQGWNISNQLGLPADVLWRQFFEGYQASLIICAPIGLIAMVDYQLLSRHRISWLFGGILLPITGAIIAFVWYQHPVQALPSLVLTGCILALVYRLADIMAGITLRGDAR